MELFIYFYIIYKYKTSIDESARYGKIFAT